MNAPFKTPTDPLDAPVWDLSDLYASREDTRIEADLEHTRGMVDELNGLQGQLVAARGEAAVLGERLDRAVSLYEQASDRLGALGAYAFLAASTDRNDAAAQGFEATVREKLTSTGQHNQTYATTCYTARSRTAHVLHILGSPPAIVLF